jgi:hypothetical protein
MDTAYLLVQHTNPGQARWTPVFQRSNTHNNNNNNNQFYYFPIGINDQQLTCVLCPVSIVTIYTYPISNK